MIADALPGSEGERRYGRVMDLGIAGKRAAVAASSAGLGFGSAKALHEAGCRVVLNGRDQERLSAAAARLEGSHAVIGDVSGVDGASAFIAEATERLGGLDIVVTNAGGPPLGNFASTAVEAYLDAVHLNMLSVIAMCKAAIPPMQERGWGRVVAITSLSVRQPMANLILSNTARAGATAFLKTVAREVAADGVTVNSVQPGSHLTDRLTGGDPNRVPSAAGIPAGFIGDPLDFGQVVAFVCSEQAKFITGAAIPVDGGADAALQ